MTISFVAAETDTSGGTLTITKPAGTVEGDLMIADLMWDNGTAPAAAPQGWFLVQELVEVTPTTISLSQFKKTATANEPANYAFTGGSDGNGNICTYTDSVGGGAWLVADKTLVDNGSTDTSVTSAVAVLSGDRLLATYNNDTDFSVSQAPFDAAGDPSEMDLESFLADAGNGNSVASYGEAITGTDASATRTLVWSGTDDTFAAALVIRYSTGATLTGTAPRADGMDQAAVKAGNHIIDIEIAGDTLVSDVASNATIRNAIRDSITASGSEAGGWNATLKIDSTASGTIPVAPTDSWTFERIDSTNLRIQLPKAGPGETNTYAITAGESVEIGLPASALTTSTQPIAVGLMKSVYAGFLWLTKGQSNARFFGRDLDSTAPTAYAPNRPGRVSDIGAGGADTSVAQAAKVMFSNFAGNASFETVSLTANGGSYALEVLYAPLHIGDYGADDVYYVNYAFDATQLNSDGAKISWSADRYLRDHPSNPNTNALSYTFDINLHKAMSDIIGAEGYEVVRMIGGGVFQGGHDSTHWGRTFQWGLNMMNTWAVSRERFGFDPVWGMFKPVLGINSTNFNLEYSFEVLNQARAFGNLWNSDPYNGNLRYGIDTSPYNFTTESHADSQTNHFGFDGMGPSVLDMVDEYNTLYDSELAAGNFTEVEWDGTTFLAVSALTLIPQFDVLTLPDLEYDAGDTLTGTLDTTGGTFSNFDGADTPANCHYRIYTSTDVAISDDLGIGSSLTALSIVPTKLQSNMILALYNNSVGLTGYKFMPTTIVPDLTAITETIDNQVKPLMAQYGNAYSTFPEYTIANLNDPLLLNDLVGDSPITSNPPDAFPGSGGGAGTQESLGANDGTQFAMDGLSFNGGSALRVTDILDSVNPGDPITLFIRGIWYQIFDGTWTGKTTGAVFIGQQTTSSQSNGLYLATAVTDDVRYGPWQIGAHARDTSGFTDDDPLVVDTEFEISAKEDTTFFVTFDGVDNYSFYRMAGDDLTIIEVDSTFEVDTVFAKDVNFLSSVGFTALTAPPANGSSAYSKIFASGGYQAVLTEPEMEAIGILINETDFTPPPPGDDNGAAVYHYLRMMGA